ncbi:MAG: universal stress protein [Geminicoccaceae bacterium]
MKRFKNILAIYDGSLGADDVLSEAISQAQANKARLMMVDVVEAGTQSYEAIEERERRLHRLVPAIQIEAAEKVAAKVLVGTPFLEIIRRVLQDEHDLVIASAEGGNVLKNVFFGSTATHLLRKCPCPVWILKPGQTTPYGRLLAAVDPKPDDPIADDLNIKIMDLATSLAAANGAHLDIVHAWDVVGADRDTLTSEIPDETRAALLRKHEDIHRLALGALLQHYRLSEISHDVLLPRGLPQRLITELVEDRGIDLIVMGTVTRTGIPGLFMGNAAETIVSVVKCGVLAVKPEGFVTPVTLTKV